MNYRFFRERGARARENLNHSQISERKTCRSIRRSILNFGLFSLVRSENFPHFFEVLRALRQGKLMIMTHFTDSCFRIQSFPISIQQILSHVEILHHFHTGGWAFSLKRLTSLACFAFLGVIFSTRSIVFSITCNLSGDARERISADSICSSPGALLFRCP